MVTMSAQSGYWGLQGGGGKPQIWFMAYVFIPILTRLFGYFPWKKLGGENLPYHVALEWAGWCRAPGYLRDDKSLPLDRYDEFNAPILAYSVDDDDWGTKASVHAMMSAYTNVTYEHLVPSEHGLGKLEHMGFFRKGSELLWDRVYKWLVAAQ
jgi:predicted alpha/beta hydrolase